MSECLIEVNGRQISVPLGETLVDGALSGRIVIPHDCSSGQCGTCRVKIVGGQCDDQGTLSRGSVLACRARITGPVAIAYDQVPDRQKIEGIVSRIDRVGPHTAEVRIETAKRLVWLTGQYAKVAFKGFPARDLSLTFPLDLSVQDEELVFQMTIHPEGLVSSQLGKAIRTGHKVSVLGPFGSAFLRRGEGGLILASTGTGFAPNFAMAVSARMGQPWRPVTLIAGARLRENLYMRNAAQVLRDRGVTVILTASDGDGAEILTSRPQEVLPALSAADTVHAAGAPGMIDAVGRLAAAAGAEFHSDTFVAAPPAPTSLGSRIKGLFSRRSELMV
jgi:3-phenylpropionate/trans-cinnamate dioxygenase ferredoxin reductase subunit